jgi:glycosyltransferase involved in cell wall biosynthesis
MSNSKVDILFVLPSLVAGGAERVISLIAKNLDASYFKVTLIVIGFEKDKAYNVDGINVTYLNKSRVLTGFPKLFWYILKNRPKIVVSCMSHLNIIMTLILVWFPKIKLVTREANIKKITAIYYQTKRSFLSSKLLKISHNRTNAIVCQSKDMADEMRSEYSISESKLHIINNPISDEFKLKSDTDNNDIVQFITVGRLHKEKGHERILNVLSKLKFDFHYTIIGTGEEFENIKTHVKNLNLTSKVSYITYTNEVTKYLNKSTVFLQGSYAEGFPNSLLESCAVGTPVVVFSAPGGTGEILEHGVNGYTATNESEYLTYINSLIEQPISAEKVSESVYRKFSKDKIINQYEDLFKMVLQNAS